MPNYVELPDGSLFPVKQGEDYSAAMRAAYAKYPDAFGGTPAAPAAEPQGGFVPALKSGISDVKSAGYALAGRTGLMDLERAKKGMEEQEQYRQKTFKPTEEGWTEAPFTKVKELLGQSLPYVAAPVAAAALAPEAAIPLGIAGLTTSGATLASLGAGALQYTGTGLSRQVQEGKKLEETNLGAAAAASIPTALLDRLSLGMIPGIRNIFGQAGKTLTAAEAKTFVEQGVKKTAADYALATGKALTGEGLTEAAQQFLERAQAGLSLTDAKARDEYWDSLVGGAVLGGVLAPAGRYMERGGEQAKARKVLADEATAQKTAQRQQAEAQAQQEAAAEAARKQTPEYAQETKTKYDQTFAQFKQLQDTVKAFGKTQDPAEKAERALAEKELKTFVKENLTPIAQEYAAVKKTGIYDKIAEQQRVAGLTPMDYMLENAQQVPNTKTKPAPMPTPYGIQPTSPELTRFKGTQQQAINFAQNQITAANDQRLTDQKSLPEQVADYTQYLLTQPKQAAYLAMNQIPLPGLNAKQSATVLDNLRTTLNMGRRAGIYDGSFNPTTPEKQLSSQPATTALGAEAEEQGILEQTAQEKEAAAQEAARREKIRPEQYALQKMQEKAGRSVMGLPGFGVEKEPITPSPAIGQMQQQLQGIPFGEGLLPTAEDVDTTAPKVQKGPGGGFRLFNERGERQLTDEQAYRSLSERLAIAASNPDLSDEAYDFLRRAEMALPKVNTRLQETRQERVKYGQGPLARGSVAQDVAEGESFYKLLDEQLARIERGEEGVHRGQRYVTKDTGRARGTAAEVAPPTEAMPYDIERNKEATPADLRRKQREAAGRKTWPNNLPFEQPAQAERRLANVPGAERERVTRATTGRTLRGKAPALSLQKELEPLIRQQEQVAGEGPLARGQGELFPAEAEKLGFAKMNRAGFVAFMKSKVVQKMRDAINKDKTVLAKAKNLPALKDKVANLTKQLETMQAKNLEYSKAASILQHARGMDKLGKDRAEANAALVDMEINRVQLAGRIEELMQLRGAFDQQVEKYGDFKNTELANRFEPLLSEYNTVQKELATLNTDLASLDASMKQLDNELRVEKARNALARLNPETVSKETIAQAQEALRAAQVEAGVTEAEASKVEQQTKQRKAQEAREAEAVRLAESEKQRIDLGRERQRRLEAAYGTSSTGQEYDFITVAQRMSQEMELVETTVKRGKRVLSNPNQVLAGYRSRITAIEKQMIAAFNKSRDARDSFLVQLAENAAKLNQQYRDAKGAEERAALLPAVENAEKLYDNATLRQQGKDEELVWKGKDKQLKALAQAYNDAETLEADINEGRVVQPEEFKRKSPKINLNKGEKEARAEAARPAEVAEAKQRATAPETSGEKGVTRMVATKARKPAKTVYSSKGLGQEGLSAEKEAAVKRAKEKQAEGKPLNPFDQRALAEAKAAAQTTFSPNEPVPPTNVKVDIDAILREAAKEKGSFARGVETITPDLTTSQVELLNKNDLVGALDSFADDKNTSKLNKVVAQRLAAMLEETSVRLVNNLTDEDGKPVLGMAKSTIITLDKNTGLSQEVLLHEGTHAATERVLVQYKQDPNKLTEIQRVAVRELQALHAAIKNDPRITSASAKGSLSEFVAEVFSNRNLQEQLRGKKWKMSDAWKGFKSIIMRMLGVKDPETMLGAALQSVDALMIPSSDRSLGAKETAINRKLSQKDIAALHTGSNSMQQFAEQFGVNIKQKDRTAEDAERIGQEYLQDMASNTADYLPQINGDLLPYDTRLADGREYDPENIVDFFEATPQTIMNYEAKNNPELRESEAMNVNEQRIEALQSLIDNLIDNPEYTTVEQALVAKAAAKFAVTADPNGRLKLSEISAKNRNPIAVVGVEDAGHVIRELRAGKNLKAAFLDGLQKNADENAQKNKSKNGWQKFEQSEDYAAAEELNAGAANTSWCTGASVSTAESQISSGDFYIYYKNGRPEVAVRMSGKDRISEIRGNTPTQALTSEHQEIAQAFLNNSAFIGASNFLRLVERKKALVDAFKNNTLVPASVMYTPDTWVKGEQTSNGEKHFTLTNSNMWGFVNFREIDGEVNEYRAVKPKNFDKVLKEKLKASLENAIQNNEYPGMEMEFFSKDPSSETAFTFGDTRYTTKLKDIKGLGALTLGYAKNVDLPALTKVNSLHIFNDVDVTLPNIKHVDYIVAYSDEKPSTVSLAKSAVVDKILPYGMPSPSGKHELTVKGVERVKEITNEEQAAKLVLNLPDAKYVAEIPFNWERAIETAKGEATNQFDNWMATNNVLDAFTRYLNDIEDKADYPKIERAAIEAFRLATNLIGKQNAERIFENSEYTTVTNAKEPITWRIAARPALKPPLPVELNQANAQYMRMITQLARDLGRPPTDAQKLARLQELKDEYDQKAAARKKTELEEARTLRPTARQMSLLESSGKTFVTDEQRVAYLENYYKTNPPKEVTKYDLREAVRSSVDFLFARDQAKGLKDRILANQEKFNAVFEPADVDRLQYVQDEINAPNKIDTAPPDTEFEETPEEPLYARASKPMYDSEDALTELANKVVAQPKSFKEKLGKNIALEAEMQAVDMRAGLREALKAGAQEMGNDDLFTQAMYNVQKADQHMPMVLASLSTGPLEFYTDEKGLRGVKSSGKDSAKEFYEAVAKVPAKNATGKTALATTYMIAQRAANKGLTALDIGALGVTEKELKDALAAANANPELKNALEEARAKYNAYNEGQIKFLAASGAIPKQLAQDLLKEGDYVPYYRVRDDGTAELVYGGEKTITIGDIRHQPYLQELKGGETKILPLDESIPRNTMLLVKKALTNVATKEIAYAMQAFGEGKGEIDPKTGKAKNLMPIHSGRNPGGPDIIVFNQEPDPKDPKDDGQRWQRIKTKGTAMEGIPAELVVESLEGAHLTLPAFLKIGGYAGDLLRKGITRMPPYILRQLYRDPMAATFTSGLNYGPLTAVLKAGKEFIAMNRGTSEAGAELMKKGLIQSGIFTGDPSDISAFALQLASGKDQGVMDRTFAMLDRAAMRADASTRALVYKNARENGLSEVEADQMVMESMNFYKRGLSPTVQYANRLIPFMNAQIQGLNVLYKAATGKMPFNERQEIQRKFFNNAMMLAATGVVYAMAMEDDDYFRDAKPKDKYSNFFLHLPGIAEPFKIAIPYEAGWFFSAGVATVDAMKAETDGKQQFRALRDMFLNAVPGYSSMYMPQAVKPIFEVWSNKNFFTGNPIESTTMQNKRIEDRYLTSTTEAAKALSRALPMLSPVQIEHLSQAYFGALPLAVMAGTSDLFAKPSAVEKPEARITDLPIIGSAFQKRFGGADTDVVYNLAKDVLQTQASFGALKKSGTAEDIKEFAIAHRPELAVAPMARAFESNMSKLRLQQDIITNRLNLSPAEKRARIDAIDKIRADMSTKFMKRIKETEERVGETIPQ
jgi:Large polyvalent protein associated domain 38